MEEIDGGAEGSWERSFDVILLTRQPERALVVWAANMGRITRMSAGRRCLVAALFFSCTGAAAGSGDTLCNMPEVGTLQAGAGASTTAHIRCAELKLHAVFPAVFLAALFALAPKGAAAGAPCNAFPA